MTHETLRDLLEDRVADLDTRDLVTGAWTEGVRRRRRRRATVLTGVAAATAVVVGVTTLARGSAPDDPAPAEPPASTDPDAVVSGAHVWWSPSLAEEPDLEQVASPLPEQIDLDEQAPEAAGTTGPPARAAIAVLDGSRVDHVLLVGDDGDRSLDVSRLGSVTKPNGYRLPPVSDTMLSPDGRTLAFGQDGAVVFFDITLGTWREVPVDGPTHELTWTHPRLLDLADGTGISVDGAPADLDPPHQAVLGVIDPAVAHGPWVRSADELSDAQAFGYGARVPARPGSSPRPETVVVDDSTAPDVLAISAETNDGRFKDCCPVAGWLDADTVVYESRSATPRLVSWDVGTRTFGLVTTLVGLADPDASYVASYAQLDLRDGGTTTAEEAAPSAPDDVADGTRVWWGPEVAAEAALPPLEGPVRPLPRGIDLASTDPVPALPWARAVVELADGRYVVLAPDGTTSLLDAGRLGPVADEGGNPLSPLTAGAGVDPGGTMVAFAQDRSVEVYSFLTRSWTTVDTGDEPAEGVRWLSGLLVLPSGAAYAVDGTPRGGRAVEWKSVAREGESAYGPTSVQEGAIAQTVRLVGPVEGGDVANPEAVVVQRGSERFALALPQDGRSKGCCPVVGLLDDETVVFRSGDALLAWEVGTHDVLRVSDVVPAGTGWTASFAELGRSR